MPSYIFDATGDKIIDVTIDDEDHDLKYYKSMADALKQLDAFSLNLIEYDYAIKRYFI